MTKELKIKQAVHYSTMVDVDFTHCQYERVYYILYTLALSRDLLDNDVQHVSLNWVNC